MTSTVRSSLVCIRHPPSVHQLKSISTSRPSAHHAQGSASSKGCECPEKPREPTSGLEPLTTVLDGEPNKIRGLMLGGLCVISALASLFRPRACYELD